MATFYLSNADASYSNGYYFDKLLSLTTLPADSITVTAPNKDTNFYHGFFYTEAGIPNNPHWEDGVINVEINVTTVPAKDTAITMSIQRRNSNGVLQEENQDDSTYYISQGTGVYKMGIYNCTWTAGDAGDILVVRFSYKNVDEHSSNSMTFETGTIDAEVITPISIITSNLPTINIVGYTKDKISDEVGYQTSTVTFQSDQDLVEWEARADGTGHGSGLLVGSGGSVTANTDVTFDVDYTELTQGDKTYQINVYGKNSDGLWSDS